MATGQQSVDPSVAARSTTTPTDARGTSDPGTGNKGTNPSTDGPRSGSPPGPPRQPETVAAPVTPPSDKSDREPASWADRLASYLDSGERPSYKVILAHIRNASRGRGLPAFARALANRPHGEWGNYLNYVFIVIQADGSKEIANLTAQMFSAQDALVVPGNRQKGAWQPETNGADAAVGTGLGAVLTYEERTLVRLSNEPFYISGRPPPGAWTPKGGSTSVLFVYRRDQPGKMYRLDFDTLKSGPAAGQPGWEHNQKGVARILKLDVTNHQPAGGWGKIAGWACRVYKWGGRGLFLVGAAGDAIGIYSALDRGRAVSKAAGRLGGAAIGAAGGAAAGGKVGSKGGMIGAGAGVLVGGALGGWFGAALGKAIADWGYCLLFTPLDAEEWVLFTQSEVTSAPTQGSK